MHDKYTYKRMRFQLPLLDIIKWRMIGDFFNVSLEITLRISLLYLKFQ